MKDVAYNMGKIIISCTSARGLVSGIYKELKIKLKVKEHNKKRHGTEQNFLKRWNTIGRDIFVLSIQSLKQQGNTC